MYSRKLYAHLPDNFCPVCKLQYTSPCIPEDSPCLCKSQTRHTFFSNRLVKSPHPPSTSCRSTMHHLSSFQKNSLPHAHSRLCLTFLTCTVCHTVTSPSSLLSFFLAPSSLLVPWKFFLCSSPGKVLYLPITKLKPAPSLPNLGEKTSLSQCVRSKILLWILLGEKPILLAKPLDEGSYHDHPLVTFLSSSCTSLQKWILFVSTNGNASWSSMEIHNPLCWSMEARSLHRTREARFFADPWKPSSSSLIPGSPSSSSPIPGSPSSSSPTPVIPSSSSPIPVSPSSSLLIPVSPTSSSLILVSSTSSLPIPGSPPSSSPIPGSPPPSSPIPGSPPSSSIPESPSSSSLIPGSMPSSLPIPGSPSSSSPIPGSPSSSPILGSPSSSALIPGKPVLFFVDQCKPTVLSVQPWKLSLYWQTFHLNVDPCKSSLFCANFQNSSTSTCVSPSTMTTRNLLTPKNSSIPTIMPSKFTIHWLHIISHTAMSNSWTSWMPLLETVFYTNPLKIRFWTAHPWHYSSACYFSGILPILVKSPLHKPQ